MTIAVYPDLKAAVAAWLDRADLDARIPDFIALAEARIAKTLRVADGEDEADIATTPGSPWIDLPPRYQEARTVILGGRALSFLTPAALAENWAGAAAGTPQHYAIVGRRLKLGPTPAGSMTGTLIHYAKAPALTDAAPTNWLIEHHPELLLYAALIDAAPFLGDDARIATWGGLFDDALGRVQDADGRARWGGGPLTINFG